MSQSDEMSFEDREALGHNAGFDPELSKLIDRALSDGWDSLTKAEQEKIADSMGYFWDDEKQEYVNADDCCDDEDGVLDDDELPGDMYDIYKNMKDCEGDAEKIDMLQYALDVAIDALAGIYEDTDIGGKALTTIAIVLGDGDETSRASDMIAASRARIAAR